MNTCFKIKITDRDDPLAVTVIETASADGLTLRYNGGDFTEWNIGSELTLTLFDETHSDGRFSHFYTGDETKFKVELFEVKADLSEQIFWSGWILPEQYSEVYKTGNVPMTIVSSDGLGRLKGKKLAKTQGEFSVIEILSMCLRAIGSEKDIFVSSGIVNVEKRLDELSIDISVYKDKDCFEILEDLSKAFANSLYSEWGAWFWQGINKRTTTGITFQRYDKDGIFLEEKSIVKSPIPVKFLTSPTITAVTPFSEVIIKKPNILLGFKQNVTKQENDGFALVTETEVAHPRGWIYSGESSLWKPTVELKSGKLDLRGTLQADDNEWIRLREPIFVKVGQKMEVEFNLSIEQLESDDTPAEEFVKNGHWRDLIKVDFIVGQFQNDFPSKTSFLSFDSNRKSENKITFVVPKTGFFDVKLYRPREQVTNDGIFRILLDEVKMAQTSITETGGEMEVRHVINDSYSLKKEIDLLISDGVRNVPQVIRLEKLLVENDFKYNQQLTINFTFVNNSRNFVAVPIGDLNIIRSYQEHIYVDRGGFGVFTKVPIISTDYNFTNGSDSVFEYDRDLLGFTILSNDPLWLKVTTFEKPLGERLNWEKWQDGITLIEAKPLADTIANVYEAMTKEPHTAIEGTVNCLLSFSSIFNFNWKGTTLRYYPTSITMDLFRGKTQGTFKETFYNQQAISNNIPPFVFAGDDKVVGNNITTANLIGEASDADGFIVSTLWEVVSGGASINSPNDLSTFVTGLTTGDNTFRLTATDNNLATASDEVTILRQPDITFSFTEQFSDFVLNSERMMQEKWQQATFTPDLPAGGTALISVKYKIQKNAKNGGIQDVFLQIIKNSSVILTRVDSEINSIVISYTAGDIILFKMKSDSQIFEPIDTNEEASGLITVEVTNITYNGVILGIPASTSVATSRP